jgi:hypothetical protein
MARPTHCLLQRGSKMSSAPPLAPLASRKDDDDDEDKRQQRKGGTKPTPALKDVARKFKERKKKKFLGLF